MIGIFETIGYVAMGFVPTLIVLEGAWRLAKRSLPALEARAR